MRVSRSWWVVVAALLYVGCTTPIDTGDAGLDLGARDVGADGSNAGDAAQVDAAQIDANADGSAACATPDADHDGHRSVACGGDDCDDTDAQRYPGNTEVCDTMRHDEDCNPLTFGTMDTDADGFTASRCCNTDAMGVMHCGDDCDDSNMSVHPGATEACNSFDDDCDTAIDEGVLATYYADADGDGYGVMSMTTTGCTLPMHYATIAGDCNDANMSIHPGAMEQCDAAQGMGTDWNCDGTRNNGCACMTSASVLCSDPMFGSMALHGVCQNATRTCVMGQWAMCSVAPSAEICDFMDNDCDGTVDEGSPHVTCYADPDNDGYPDASVTMGTPRCPDASRPAVGGCPSMSTDRPPISGNIDCNSNDASVHPGAGFQPTPYCPMGMVSCRLTATSPWLCIPTGTAGCPGSTPASFDYDCDGMATLEPASSCSSSGAACTTGCGTNGYVYGAMPMCGAMLSYQTCGSCGGTCSAPTTVMQAIGCR